MNIVEENVPSKTALALRHCINYNTGTKGALIAGRNHESNVSRRPV
jgi:hypothetical protein